eukprot:scaffold106867_cov18-Tisochrysis_lutea.AAC.1
MHAQYKYLASLDGLAGSSRILPLLHSGSVVVRQQLSPYLEWFYKSLQPGVESVSNCAAHRSSLSLCPGAVLQLAPPQCGESMAGFF